ncbi:MAG: DMT family transporter [Lachnospiraceae bacterium]|nr:DMT family transporter [Candidatus Equihabitans merdae]
MNSEIDNKENMTTEKSPVKKKITVLSLLLIQSGVVVYTMSGICSKMTSRFPFMSFGWILWLFLEVFALGFYAIFWQQIIKRVDLSIAYANRAFAIFWSMLWAVLIFGERVTLQNILGVIVIFAGIMLVNQDVR